MSFNPNALKRSKFFSPKFPPIPAEEGMEIVVVKQSPHLADAPFVQNTVLALNVKYFLGTDDKGERDQYRSSIVRELKNQITQPIANYWDNRRAYFFKPYSSLFDGLLGLCNGPMNALGSPSITIAIVCLPALIQLITGLASLIQGLYHKSRAELTHQQNEREMACEYFLDASTRLAVVVPLAAMCLVAVPFEVARFFTRVIASLTQLIGGKDLSVPAVEQEAQAFNV